MADIFISYAREDIEYAQALVELLKRKGWDVFWDRELLPGPNFREVLARELDEARCVIVLWSAESVKSVWVADEAEEGKRDSRLVSVLIDDVRPPLGFRQGQAANLWNWDKSSENEETLSLTEGVQAVIEGRVGVVSPDTTTPSKGVSDSAPQAPTHAPLEARAELPPVTAASFTERHPAIMPTVFLVALFVLNWLQTTFDSQTTPAFLGAEGGYPFAEAFAWAEGYLRFDFHDMTNPVAYKGYSIAYFFLFPFLALAVAMALAWRGNPLPYRTFSLAIIINYLICLPFYLFVPVPERWAWPQTEAVLLSDLWNESLITFFRPISGLDNCFPSFHTSMTVVIVAVCFLYDVRMKTSVLFLGATIVLATFVLGIHWIPDIFSGIAAGLTSVALARYLESRGSLDFLWR